MGEFNLRLNYDDIKLTLRKSISVSNLYLQLVWLTELLLIHFYVLHDVKLLRHKDKTTVLYSYSFMSKDLARKFPELQEVVEVLIKYRHSFVHEGCLAAELNYNLLMMYKTELMELAKIADVQLSL